METRALARRLISLAIEGEPIDLEVGFDRFGVEEDRNLVEMYGAFERLIGPAEEMVGELQQTLPAQGWSPDGIMTSQGQGHWTFGTALTLRGSKRAIRGGFLQPIRRIPILERMPETVVLYLLTVEKGEDYLDRETHGMGWHYHYLDWKERRSDVIVSWDTRWQPPASQTKPSAQRGLFVEKHAEKGKPFRGKPWLWGSRKRQTMYDVCAVDLAKRKIDEFRCAADKADLVFPLGATLTPRPASVITVATSKSSRRRKLGAYCPGCHVGAR